jgi:hypothetical protein
MKQFFSFVQKLKPKQHIAAIAILIGAILIIFARISMQKAEKAKHTIDYLSDFFTNSTGIWNPVIEFFGGQAHKAASKYDTTLSILLGLGILLVVVGLGSLFWHRRK